ncbi:MAG TPA: hypothetical protein VGG83_02220 [Trebonia sp.]|jgi:hypothetical protein
MADTTTSQTAGPLQFPESGAAGYCDPVTGLCGVPAADPELRGAPEATALPDHAENAMPGVPPHPGLTRPVA